VFSVWAFSNFSRVCAVIHSSISFPSLISISFSLPFRSSRDLIRRIWNPITGYSGSWKLSFLKPACLHLDVTRRPLYSEDAWRICCFQVLWYPYLGLWWRNVHVFLSLGLSIK
jgi:hypothetical protein